MLRRSREMTPLCSPKVTQHHASAVVLLPAGKRRFLPLGKSREQFHRSFAALVLRPVEHGQAECNRRGVNRQQLMLEAELAFVARRFSLAVLEQVVKHRFGLSRFKKRPIQLPSVKNNRAGSVIRCRELATVSIGSSCTSRRRRVVQALPTGARDAKPAPESVRLRRRSLSARRP